MNTGIGDAINLAWKLAAVLAGRRAATVCSTATRPSGSALRGGWSRPPIACSALPPPKAGSPTSLRTRIAPHADSQGRRVSRRFASILFRTVSQITLNYRGGPLSGGVGRACAWRRPAAMGARSTATDNFAPLAAMTWQVHVYGSATAELRGLVRRSRCAAACLRLATGTRGGGPGARCALSAPTGYLCGAGRSIWLMAGVGAIFWRSENHTRPVNGSRMIPA